MKILDIIYGGRLFSYSRQRVIAMLVLSSIMIIGAVYSSIVLPVEDKWVGGVALCGSSLLFLVLLLLLKHVYKKERVDKTKSYLIEIFLLLSILVFCLLNLLIGFSSFAYGYSKLGGSILFFSIIVFLFRQWKYRFLYLISLLLLGIGLIELGAA